MSIYMQYVNDGPWTYLKLHKCVRMSRGLLLFRMSPRMWTVSKFTARAT